MSEEDLDVDVPKYLRDDDSDLRIRIKKIEREVSEYMREKSIEQLDFKNDPRTVGGSRNTPFP